MTVKWPRAGTKSNQCLRLWNQGWTEAEIGKRLGWQENTAQSVVSNWRTLNQALSRVVPVLTRAEWQAVRDAKEPNNAAGTLGGEGMSNEPRLWREGQFGMWLEAGGRVFKYDGAFWHSVNYMGAALEGPTRWGSAAKDLRELEPAIAASTHKRILELERTGHVWDRYAYDHGHMRCNADIEEPNNDT